MNTQPHSWCQRDLGFKYVRQPRVHFEHGFEDLKWRKPNLRGASRDKKSIHPLTESLLSERGWGEVLIDLVGDGKNTLWSSQTVPVFFLFSDRSKLLTMTETLHKHLFTYSMMRSFEEFGLSANSWQLRTLNPYPSQGSPLISADLMVMGSRPVFSTLKVRLRVKFGSLTFVSEGRETIRRGSLRVKQSFNVITVQAIKSYADILWCRSCLSLTEISGLREVTRDHFSMYQ